MSVLKNHSRALILLAGSVLFGTFSAQGAEGLTLYTPHTKISVPPGESINYTVDVINDGDTLVNTGIAVTGLPRGWEYTLKSGAWNIQQIAVLQGEKKQLSLRVEVPLAVNKGDYHFKLVAGSLSTLPLVVNVSEKGTYKTEFTADQANMQGDAKSSFTFKTDLKNRTADKQLYSLRTDVPRGWAVTFKPDYKQATSVEIEANASKGVTIDVNPPDNIVAGTYKVPVSAVTSTTSASLELEVVITGTYDMELTTPMGLLSARITAGSERRLDLIINNTGSSELNNVTLTASKPVSWEVVFDPKEIDRIGAGETAAVTATVKADKKAIAGDYVTTFTARTPEISSSATFRMSVRTPMLWGWIGIFIIIGAAGFVYYLFRKYGRR
jgi:uncharacterized membrane protein